MGKALYRKYRSKSLSEIIGQEHVTKTLSNALKSGSVSHAYLFTGPRGVGKTSIARILAHEVNKLAYDDKATHLDIIEIDAASNRRIDEIRELRERIGNAPTSAKYKVYIIDEVHMLTKEAFNALLKTLEEPPEHVIFILATTEAHKLPETIISRTQRFTFKPIDVQKAAKHLAEIAKKEKIEATPEALELIAKHGDGSFRDSISLLDQAAALSKRIDAEAVRAMLGEVPEAALQRLASSMASGDSSGVIAILKQLREQGIQPAMIAKQLAEHIRTHLILGQQLLDREMTMNLLSKLIEVPASHDPTSQLEITLLEPTLIKDAAAIIKPQPVSSQPDEVAQPATEKPKSKSADSIVNSLKTKPVVTGSFNESAWPKILDAIKAKHNTLYSLVRMATPSFTPTEVILEFNFPFHQKRLNEERNKKVVTTVIRELTGQDIIVTCVLSGKKPSPIKHTEKIVKPSSAIDSISNIFGSAEVLE